MQLPNANGRVQAGLIRQPGGTGSSALGTYPVSSPMFKTVGDSNARDLGTSSSAVQVIEMPRPVERVIEMPKTQLVNKFVDVPMTLYQERVVEIPQVQVAELMKEVSRVQEMVMDREVTKVVIQPQEVIVEVPTALTREYLVEVPEVQAVELTRHRLQLKRGLFSYCFTYLLHNYSTIILFLIEIN